MEKDCLWTAGQDGPALVGSCCPNCQIKYFPPRQICSHCFQEGLAPVALSRRGQVYAMTRIWVKSPVIQEHPYQVGYVLLDDGITVAARLQSEVQQIGERVEVAVGVLGQRTGGEAITGYFFKPAGEEGA